VFTRFVLNKAVGCTEAPLNFDLDAGKRISFTEPQLRAMVEKGLDVALDPCNETATKALEAARADVKGEAYRPPNEVAESPEGHSEGGEGSSEPSGDEGDEESETPPAPSRKKRGRKN